MIESNLTTTVYTGILTASLNKQHNNKKDASKPPSLKTRPNVKLSQHTVIRNIYGLANI